MKKTKQFTGIMVALMLLIGCVMPVPIQATEAEGQDQAEGQEVKSGDNSLSALSISPGALSPAFQYSVTNYTASVGADVSSIEVDAKTSHEAAEIVSITGNTDLQEGQNTISILVKAENGTPVTYKIEVTKGEGAGAPADAPDSQPSEEGQPAQPSGEGQEQQGDPDGINLGGHPFNLAAAVPADRIPQDFSVVSITCKGQQVEGLQFDKQPSLKLVYLTTPSKDVKNTLAVYDEASGRLSSFRMVALGERYLILLDPPADTGLSEAFSQAATAVDGYEDVPMFTGGSLGEGFSLVYAASSSGNLGWYQYDAEDGTYQRYQKEKDTPVADDADLKGSEEPGSQQGEASVEMQGLQKAYKDLEEQYNQAKDTSRKITAIMLFLIVVLVVVIVNLILRQRREMEEEWDYGYHPLDEVEITEGQNWKSNDSSDGTELKHGKRNSREDDWDQDGMDVSEEDWERKSQGYVEDGWEDDGFKGHKQGSPKQEEQDGFEVIDLEDL